MNDVMKTITTRRSIRKFTKKEVSKEVIELLLTAAMNAPTACNQQAWYFFVITDKDKLKRLSSLHGGLHFVKDAPLAIVICGDPSSAILDYYWIDDCAAATQNLLLAAHSLGLGSTWTGINHYDNDAIDFYRQNINIPVQYIPFAMIPIGYPAEHKPLNNKYNEKKVVWN